MHHLGLTRSVRRLDHLLLTPDTFVRTPLPGLRNGAAIVHVSPEIGAGFTQMTVEFGAGGELRAPGATQRFVYVLDGEVSVGSAGGDKLLSVENFAYLPQNDSYALKTTAAARIVLIEKPLQPLAGSFTPDVLYGDEAAVASTPLNGDDDLQVRTLLPLDLTHDFACNTMTYAPGASLSQVEVHYMEHGLLMLEGGGIYRLGEHWYPVQAGDFIWMAPYCPQWFCAVGKQSAKYLIYKNFNRHPGA